MFYKVHDFHFLWERGLSKSTTTPPPLPPHTHFIPLN